MGLCWWSSSHCTVYYGQRPGFEGRPGSDMAKRKRASRCAASPVPAASNWERLRSKIEVSKKRRHQPQQEGTASNAIKPQDAVTKRVASKRPETKEKRTKRRKPEATLPDPFRLLESERLKIVAMDCEMVGVGVAGKESALARCSVVGGEGSVLYDKHVCPNERITDFRTRYSGVRARDLKASAVTLRECQDAVAKLLKGKLLVGHALHNDLKVLLLSHPTHMTRDTAKYAPLMRVNGAGKRRARKLRDLAKEHVGLNIQESEHSSVEDARAALFVYLKHRVAWESTLVQRRFAKRKAALQISGE